MEFEIPESLAQVLAGLVRADSPLAQRLSERAGCHGKTVVSSQLFDAAALNTLYSLSKAADERELMFQMLALDNIFGAPDARQIPNLEMLIPGLVAYLARDAIDGWIYKRSKDGVLLPWLVHGMRHVMPAEGAPFVVVSLLANTLQAAGKEGSSDPRMRHSGMTNAIMVDAHEIENRTIPALLAERGYFKECAEFKREYETHARRFMALQPRFGAQLVASDAAYLVAAAPGPGGGASPSLRPGGIPSGASQAAGALELLSLKKNAAPARCVNDEALLDRRFVMTADADFWRTSGVADGFDKVPLHGYLYLFHLGLHRNLWVHAQHLADYRYKPELRDKLILPQAHRDLIDILTSEMNVLMEDIVEGKSGGTTILCKGAPGLGKTLTAEVYAEVVGKPLYRVHSGQLGITAESVEANLSKILQRAARWDSILLLDEADVYIRRRDNDLQHNAIVAEFLRTLEYFNGLLFMTTNRIADIDDAILSRCIAIIQYDTPSRDDAMRIWRSMAGQFDAELSDELIATLTQTYAGASGRDIKELLKLTAKFCKRKQMAFSEDAFAQCAAFRSIGAAAV